MVIKMGTVKMETGIRWNNIIQNKIKQQLL